MIQSLLRSQTHCLINILNLTQDFIEHWSASKDAASDAFVYHSSQLYQRRQKWFVHIERIQRQLDDSTAQVAPTATDELIHEQIRSQMSLLIEQIKDQDQKVEKLIEQNQGKIEKTLLNARKNRQILGKFKSNQTGKSGNELDRTL